MSNAGQKGRVGIRSRFANALKPRKSSGVLRKDARRASSATQDAPLPELPVAPLQAHREKYKAVHQQIDSQVGERRDYTELIHAIGRVDPFDSEPEPDESDTDARPPGEILVGSLSPELWDLVTDFLEPIEAARLAISSWTLYTRLVPRPFQILNRRENYRAKIQFLLDMNDKLPDHLLCFPCAQYHRRLNPGSERLLPTATQATRPLFICPNARNATRAPPRLLLAPGRSLPFSFAQLVMRSQRHSEEYGITADSLAKHWALEHWQHSTRYTVHAGHLLLRAIGQAYTPPHLTPSGKRALLFDRADYMPCWSVCAHWRHGDMTAVAKCALSHVPVQASEGALTRVEARVRQGIGGARAEPDAAAGGVQAAQCARCKPLRRCTMCPTEYLFQVKLVESKCAGRHRSLAAAAAPLVWRYALVVTRWSDLGEGHSPMQGEWAACVNDEKGSGYEAPTALQKRSLAAIFESALTGENVPTQQILSLNPSGRRRDNLDDESWY